MDEEISQRSPWWKEQAAGTCVVVVVDVVVTSLFSFLPGRLRCGGAGTGVSREPNGQRVVPEYWRPECCPGLAKGRQSAGAFEGPAKHC